MTKHDSEQPLPKHADALPAWPVELEAKHATNSIAQGNALVADKHTSVSEALVMRSIRPASGVFGLNHYCFLHLSLGDLASLGFLDSQLHHVSYACCTKSSPYHLTYASP